MKQKHSITPLNIWALAFGCIVGWAAFVMPGGFMLDLAGPVGTVFALLLGMIFLLPIAFNFHFMLHALPEKDGVYSYTRQAFGRERGFLCAWITALAHISMIAMNGIAAAMIITRLLSSVFPHLQIPFLQQMIAFAFLAFFAQIAIRGIQFAGFLQTILALVLLFVVVIVLVSAGRNQSIDINHLLPFFHPGISPLTGSLFVFVLSPCIFLGFTAISHFREEAKLSKASSILITLFAMLLGGGIYFILTILIALTGSTSEASWLQTIEQSCHMNGILSLPVFYSGHLMFGNSGIFALLVAAFAAIFACTASYYKSSARLLFTVSEDSLLPKWFRILTNRLIPGNLLIFILFIAALLSVFGEQALIWLPQAASFCAAIGFLYVSAATLMLAKADHRRIYVFTGILGSLTALLFIILIAVTMKHQAYLLISVWCIIGFIFYWRAFQKVL